MTQYSFKEKLPILILQFNDDASYIFMNYYVLMNCYDRNM
jgi:hypothetical protein